MFSFSVHGFLTFDLWQQGDFGDEAGRQRQAEAGTGGHRQAQAGTGRHRQAQAGTGRHRQAQSDTGRHRQADTGQQGAGTRAGTREAQGHAQRGKAGRGRQRQAEVGRGRQRQAEAGRGRQRQQRGKAEAAERQAEAGSQGGRPGRHGGRQAGRQAGRHRAITPCTFNNLTVGTHKPALLAGHWQAAVRLGLFRLVNKAPAEGLTCHPISFGRRAGVLKRRHALCVCSSSSTQTADSHRVHARACHCVHSVHSVHYATSSYNTLHIQQPYSLHTQALFWQDIGRRRSG